VLILVERLLFECEVKEMVLSRAGQAAGRGYVEGLKNNSPEHSLLR
jgi:hypothetical protein